MACRTGALGENSADQKLPIPGSRRGSGCHSELFFFWDGVLSMTNVHRRCLLLPNLKPRPASSGSSWSEMDLIPGKTFASLQA